MNRICPEEEVLSEYLHNVISQENRDMVECHLAKCDNCRKLIASAYEVIKESRILIMKRSLSNFLKNNKWLVASFVFFGFSFLFSKYFLQFLLIASLAGLKWITDTRATKTLIMVHEAWKSGDKNKAEEIFSRLKHKN